MSTPKFLFSQIFDVTEADLHEFNAFNISLVTDLPLFIDPFLLFASTKPEYKTLHDEMIKYLTFLRDKSAGGSVTDGQLDAWYRFKEVKETWLGFCKTGNTGRGLGKKFAQALNSNFEFLFSNFGDEQITDGTHLEKLCLVSSGVGKDTISDFTTNLVKNFLLGYTQSFARKYIDASHCRNVAVNRAYFDYELERWQPKTYYLPVHNAKHVLLTPKDVLTKDETWINKTDVINSFEEIPDAIPNAQLRAEINNYFRKVLPKAPRKKEKVEAIGKTLIRFPALIDYYIKLKENDGSTAKRQSIEVVLDSQRLFVESATDLAQLLSAGSGFYEIEPNSEQATRRRILFLKDVIENKGGWRSFYRGTRPIPREDDLQVMFRLTWFASRFDVGREVDDGRGPVDFKVSEGASDKTLVEMKLASNSQLAKNLEHQLEIYQKASDAPKGFKVIIYFTPSELRKVERLLKKLNLSDKHNVILIDARRDNKPSASKATSH